MIEVWQQSLLDLSRRLKAGELSSTEVTRACLARIEDTESELNAYVRITADMALAAAKQADMEIAAGAWRGPLHGVPVAVKDLYDAAGTPTTGSSKVRANWMRDADSVVVARLKEAGAVLMGKTHTHEFAFGGMTPQSRNPWDVRRTPGGSSGGSAASVAVGGVFMATGTDTAGSIRIPSAMCGTVGMKPTYGRVGRSGITSLSWGLDHAGPLTRTVADAAACLQVMAGYDACDPGALDEPVPDFSVGLGAGVKGLRVGVPTNYFFHHVDPEVETAVRRVYEQLEHLGTRLVEVEIPLSEEIVPVLFATVMPEASAYHRRLLRATPELYTEEVRRLLEVGNLVPAVDYIQAQRVRQCIKMRCREMYDDIDVLVTPTVPKTADLANAASVTWADGAQESLVFAYVRLTAFADVTGLPALSLPCGLSKEGLPIGVQIIGKPLDEATVLRAGAAFEGVGGCMGVRPNV